MITVIESPLIRIVFSDAYGGVGNILFGNAQEAIPCTVVSINVDKLKELVTVTLVLLSKDINRSDVASTFVFPQDSTSIYLIKT